MTFGFLECLRLAFNQLLSAPKSFVDEVVSAKFQIRSASAVWMPLSSVSEEFEKCSPWKILYYENEDVSYSRQVKVIKI